MRILPGVLFVLSMVAPASADAGADPERPVAVRVGDVRWTTEIASVPVMPSESITIEVLDPARGFWTLAVPAGKPTRRAPNVWRWRAPSQPGLVTAHIVAAGADKPAVELKLMVMIPAASVKSGRLNGYRIGSYPAKPLAGNPLYLRPRGFIEVTEDNADEKISPRFRLGQFTSKQSAAFPKYIVIDPDLLVALERLADRLDGLGLPAKLHVMSGYRTPFYNHAIGNVRYSLHQWGVAADVFVDDDEDGRMDDLNKDGRIDRRDAAELFRIANALSAGAPGTRPFAGGLGVYGATAAHGPFVHIDVRGRAARW
jgi:hypothetical protein